MRTKKRILTITVISVVSVIVAVLVAISSCEKKDQPSEFASPSSQTPQSETSQEPFTVVEEMPAFPGGDLALMNFIGTNTTYPTAAAEKKIQGKVIVRFAISAEGQVEQATILKGVCPELDNEALRVAKSLPAFTPGKQGGEPVPVWYMIPITFALK